MNSPTVLCVDDRPETLELRKVTLESHGYRVKIASSGYSAMKLLDEASVAAVLLEYKEEGMDAEAIACHVKQRFPNLPVILLSAYAELPERILCLVDEYLMKSEFPGGLVRIIERAMHPYRPAPYSRERTSSIAGQQHDFSAAAPIRGALSGGTFFGRSRSHLRQLSFQELC